VNSSAPLRYFFPATKTLTNQGGARAKAGKQGVHFEVERFNAITLSIDQVVF
jgi:hypothetical protein